MLFREDAVARAEAKAVRERAGWYRWTHDLVEVSGLDAERFPDWMLVNRIAGTPEGRGKYTTMLDERGEIIDDLVAFNRGGAFGGSRRSTGRMPCAGSKRTARAST